MAQVPLNYGASAEDGTGDPLRMTFAKIQANLTDLDTRLSSTTAIVGTLSTVATAQFGTAAGTVADGGALAAETIRAKGAEQTNATAISNEVSRAQAAEALLAPIASPSFTGVPLAPTAAAGTGTNQIATCQFVATAVAAGGGGGGGTGGVPTSRQILTAGLATGGGDLTADRTITVPKAAQSDVATGTDDTKALTSYAVAAALGAKAPLASPALVGTPTAPTAAAGTQTTQIATTAFVAGAIGNVQRTAFRFVATQGQTTFSGPDAASLPFSYTVGLVVPFVNGRRLSPPDFTATDGTSVVLSTGVNAGDEVLIVSDAAFTVANTYTQAQSNATFAPLASPALTGNPTAPTQAAGDNSTKVATTAYADRAAKAAPYVVAETIGNPGYRKWSDGLIEQWARITFSSGADASVTWPIALTTAVDSLVHAVETGDTAGTTLYASKADSVTLTGANFRIRYVTNGGTVTFSGNGSVLSYYLKGR